jgi:hypothetical protein
MYRVKKLSMNYKFSKTCIFRFSYARKNIFYLFHFSNISNKKFNSARNNKPIKNNSLLSYICDKMEGDKKDDDLNISLSSKSLQKEKAKADKKSNKKLAKAINVLKFHEAGTENPREIFSSEPTASIWVYHFGNGDEDDQKGIKEYFNNFGECKVFMFPGISYGFIEFNDIEIAKKVIHTIEEPELKEESNINPKASHIPVKTTYIHGEHDIKFSSGERKVFVFYSKIPLAQVNENNNSTFPIASYKIDIPGLYIIDDFISEEEEKTMIQNIDSFEWTKLSHRRVQHYGYEFIYGANNVNKNKKIGELPEFGLNMNQSKNNFLNKFYYIFRIRKFAKKI